MTHATHARRLLGAAALLAFLAGCAGGEGPSEGGAATTATTARTYTLRGVVLELPAAADGSLTLRHEALPEFVDHMGNQVGMDSMAMPFPLARDVALEGVAEGDPIAITLVVDWEAEQPILVTNVRELPPSTELELGKTPP